MHIRGGQLQVMLNSTKHQFEFTGMNVGAGAVRQVERWADQISCVYDVADSIQIASNNGIPVAGTLASPLAP